LIKLEKKKLKKPNHEKNRIKYFKKYSVWFGFDFISLKLKNQTKPKNKKTEPNRNKPIKKVKKKQKKNNIVFCF
jgi:hypothetical protein